MFVLHILVAQGGDWGYFVTRAITRYYPTHCLACHNNFVPAKPTIFRALWLGVRYYLGWLSEDEKRSLSRSGWYAKDGSGYMIQQSSKPNSLGFGLADSPVALLAWVYEKLHDWTDAYPWTDDEILEWISIYQFSTPGPASSLTIYYEVMRIQRDELAKTTEYIPNVPLGLSFYPKDVLYPPVSWGKSLGPVVFQAVHESGGHFAAYERPESFAGDLREMFGGEGGASKVAQFFGSS